MAQRQLDVQILKNDFRLLTHIIFKNSLKHDHKSKVRADLIRLLRVLSSLSQPIIHFMLYQKVKATKLKGDILEFFLKKIKCIFISQDSQIKGNQSFLKLKNVQLKGHNQENAKIPDVTVNTCNPSTWEMKMKAGGFVQCHPCLHGKFKASLR